MGYILQILLDILWDILVKNCWLNFDKLWDIQMAANRDWRPL